MIYYFSGTGNSRRVASLLSEKLGEKLCFIPELDPYVQFFEGHSLGFVFPVYAWGVPPIVLEFIGRLRETMVRGLIDSNIPLWVVMTYGDEAGNAMKIFQKAIHNRNLHIAGAWGVTMPNVYVLLPGFGVDSKQVENKKLSAMEQKVEAIADSIKSDKYVNDVLRGPLAGIKTALIFPLFRKWGVNPTKWHVSADCISCGRCMRACPIGNIALVDGKPLWGPNCTSCCGCYHVCPVHAINYGKATIGKGQYYLSHSS